MVSLNARCALILTLLFSFTAFQTVGAVQRPLIRVYLGDSERPVTPLNAITQSMLRFLGYYNGKIDNVPGNKTKTALALYQSDQGLSASGRLNKTTLRTLKDAVKRQIRSRVGRSLDGRWAKPGECRTGAFEIRGHMIIRHKANRLSTPRLDFFEFGPDGSFVPMIRDTGVSMLVTPGGKIAERRETALTLPRQKPGALEKFREEQAQRRVAAASAPNTGETDTGETGAGITKARPEPNGPEPNRPGSAATPLAIDKAKAKADAISELRRAVEELNALAAGSGTLIDESGLKPLEEPEPRAVAPLTVPPLTVKPLTVKPLTVKPLTVKPAINRAGSAPRPKIKPSVQRATNYTGIVEYQRCG